jgi:predicted RecB family nuclease
MMKEGKSLIYQGSIERRAGEVIYRRRPDLLEKLSVSSSFGEWIYVPVDIKSSSEPKVLHKQQLAFYCMILSSVQGVSLALAVVVNKDFRNLEVIIDQKILDKTQDDIKAVLEILKEKTCSTYFKINETDSLVSRVLEGGRIT